jgi:hypothetical protein
MHKITLSKDQIKSVKNFICKRKDREVLNHLQVKGGKFCATNGAVAYIDVLRIDEMLEDGVYKITSYTNDGVIVEKTVWTPVNFDSIIPRDNKVKFEVSLLKEYYSKNISKLVIDMKDKCNSYFDCDLLSLLPFGSYEVTCNENTPASFTINTSMYLITPFYPDRQ